jgi:hypothetical protein
MHMPTTDHDDLFFGPPALLTGENQEQYYALLKDLTDDVQPTDVFQRMWIRDIADLWWETLRWRRAKLKLLKVKDSPGLTYLDKDRTMIGRAMDIERLSGWIEARRSAAYQELMNHNTKFAALLGNKMKELEAAVANENTPQDDVDADGDTEASSEALEDVGRAEDEVIEQEEVQDQEEEPVSAEDTDEVNLTAEATPEEDQELTGTDA